MGGPPGGVRDLGRRASGGALYAEAALTRAQAGQLELAPDAAASAVSAVAAADLDVRSIALRARGGGNPVIPLVADLTAAVGKEYGPTVHRGATSQDILDTALMLVSPVARWTWSWRIWSGRRGP